MWRRWHIHRYMGWGTYSGVLEARQCYKCGKHDYRIRSAEWWPYV
jgi:hypothetical protein